MSSSNHISTQWSASLRRALDRQSSIDEFILPPLPEGLEVTRKQVLLPTTQASDQSDEVKQRIYAYSNLCAPSMTHYADNHYLQNLLKWCAIRGVFIHPAVEIFHERSDYRDFSFRLKFAVPRHTPLIAVPEELVIGFKEDVSDFDRNALFDAQKETNFFRANHGSDRKESSLPALSNSNFDTRSESQSDADICDFFFYCLGTIVADLVTAQNSQLTDKRADFAKNLTRIRTLQNAPYLPENIAFASKKTAVASKPTKTEESTQNDSLKEVPQKSKENTHKKTKSQRTKTADEGKIDEPAVEEEECSLADILLQMIRNYINGGPLVGKLDRANLMAAVSICLSHSTPLIIGPKRSIGIVPLVHLFPHGGTKTNAVVIGRPDDTSGEFRELLRSKRSKTQSSVVSAAYEMAMYFSAICGHDFTKYIVQGDEKVNQKSGTTKGYVYVVALKEMYCGESVQIQAMAPVCSKEEESHHMWQLSCGTAPKEFLPTSTVAEIARLTLTEVLGGSAKK